MFRGNHTVESFSGSVRRHRSQTDHMLMISFICQHVRLAGLHGADCPGGGREGGRGSVKQGREERNKRAKKTDGVSEIVSSEAHIKHDCITNWLVCEECCKC